MGKYFGTDGFRGVANETLTSIHAFRVGRFLGRYFRRGKSGRVKLLIGKDTRRSSYTLESSLAAGATASGADVYLLHVTTTPSVSYLTRTEKFDCGVMISASHNPFADNGIKLFCSSGEKLEDAVIRRIEDYLDGGELPLATGEEVGRTVDWVAGRNRYLAYLLALPRVSFRGVKVGLDCANGSAFMLAKAVFDALGANTYAIGTEPNGVNINDGVGSTHPERLIRLVKENALDVGFAFDGDADRCIAVDERGELVDGDAALYLFARRMKEEGDTSDVVATPMSNHGLERSLAAEGIKVRYSDVGDRFVYEKMLKENCLLGGEKSGHIILRKFAQGGDGLLTALKMLETMLAKMCPLSMLTEGYHPLPQAILSVKTARPKEVIARLEARRRQEEEAIAGRIVLRASGTEPVVRILVEAEDAAACERTASALERAVRAAKEEI